MSVSFTLTHCTLKMLPLNAFPLHSYCHHPNPSSSSSHSWKTAAVPVLTPGLLFLSPRTVLLSLTLVSSMHCPFPLDLCTTLCHFFNSLLLCKCKELCYQCPQEAFLQPPSSSTLPNLYNINTVIHN